MDNKYLIERFCIERKKFDRSGIYAYTQRTFAYNSNKIEGSMLTEEQAASLFDTGMLHCRKKNRESLASAGLFLSSEKKDMF